MPLYMEFHKAANLSMEALTTRASAGNEILNQFNVKYHQFWFSEETGTVFCLIEGPSRNICESVHRALYGTGFDSLTTVKECLASDHQEGRTENYSRFSVRKGYIVMASITEVETVSGNDQRQVDARGIVSELMRCDSGVEIDSESSESVVAYFSSAVHALGCAAEIQNKLLIEGQEKFRVAVLPNLSEVSGESVFLDHARELQSVCEDSCVVISSTLRDVVKQHHPNFRQFRILTVQEELFLGSIFHILTQHLQDEHFNVESLAHFAGISRPQLYRKIHSLTGRSPNTFIRDLRMEKALSLLRRRDRNICEVAFEVGYTNPSYFARTFAEKFGCTPSDYLMISALT
jgi:AraC-like DNA-binding protein